MKLAVGTALALVMLAGCSGPSAPGPKSQEATVAAPSYEATGWTAKTLPELSDALAAGQVTSLTPAGP